MSLHIFDSVSLIFILSVFINYLIAHFIVIFFIPLKELEQCIGCMVQQVNVTLNRQCESSLTPSSSSAAINSNQSLDSNQCGICYCRPLWCLECLARWFASRQTNMRCPPTQWLSGRVPCPTCRTNFCARDVSRLIISHRQLD